MLISIKLRYVLKYDFLHYLFVSHLLLKWLHCLFIWWGGGLIIAVILFTQTYYTQSKWVKNNNIIKLRLFYLHHTYTYRYCYTKTFPIAAPGSLLRFVMQLVHAEATYLQRWG